MWITLLSVFDIFMALYVSNTINLYNLSVNMIFVFFFLSFIVYRIILFKWLRTTGLPYSLWLSFKHLQKFELIILVFCLKLPLSKKKKKMTTENNSTKHFQYFLYKFRTTMFTLPWGSTFRRVIYTPLPRIDFDVNVLLQQ